MAKELKPIIAVDQGPGKVREVGPTTGWYNERCHIVPDGNVNRWRCANCNLIHFFCIKCKQFKTIPDAWEETSVWTLDKRMQFACATGWACDSCWAAYKEKVRINPKPEKKIYVYG